MEKCSTEGVDADSSRECSEIGDNSPCPCTVSVTREGDKGGVQW